LLFALLTQFHRRKSAVKLHALSDQSGGIRTNHLTLFWRLQ
jgi:hypothetical protein